MRFGIGFIVLLLGVGLYLWLSADNAKSVITASKPAREAAVEISGRDMKGSYELTAVESNGKTTALEVTKLDPTSPLATMYDLKVGDKIVEVGPLSLKDSDEEMIKAQVAESGARGHDIVVLRGTQRVKLENHGSAAKLGGKSFGGVNIPTH